MTEPTIRPRDRDAIIQSLRAGVVPRTGQHLIRSVAMEKKLVTAHADLTPDRRLYGTDGQARSLYAELMRNLATRAKPEGGALASVVERFIGSALDEARASGGTPEDVIRHRLAYGATPAPRARVQRPARWDRVDHRRRHAYRVG
jgi:hypothetical protein